MTRRRTFWLVVAVIFTIVNLVGIPYAAMMHEMPHTAAHVVLAAAGAIVVWALSPFSRRRAARGAPPSPEIGNRLTGLEQSIDAMAIEVERIGEGQRFMTKLFAEEGMRRPDKAGESADQPRDGRETRGSDR